MLRPRAAAGIAIIAVIAGGPRAPASHVAGPPELVGDTRTHIVAAGDTLAALGARFGVEPATLAQDNGLPPAARLVPGARLTIDNRHVVPAYVAEGALLINVPQRMLFIGETTGRVAGFPAAVGSRGWATPLGLFTVVMLERNPTWDVPASIHEEARRQGRILPTKVPPGPDNPLGAYWIGLSIGGVGIHGTNAPGSIYRAVTHGCIRLHPDDIAAVFPRVPAGAPGRIVYLPVLLGVQAGRVFVEAHRDIYGRGPSNAIGTLRMLASQRGMEQWIDWTAVEVVVAARHGVARDVTRASAME